MNIIGDLIISVIAGGLHEKLKVTLKENHTNKLIDNLKRTASSNSLELHQNELYYNDLDAYVSKNNIVPQLIEICYHKGSPNFKTKKEFAKDQVNLFTDTNKKYLVARNELIEIFENLYATVDSTLNNVKEEDRILFNAIKEGNHVIGGKINEGIDRLSDKIDGLLPHSGTDTAGSDFKALSTDPLSRYLTKQPGIADKYFAHRDETVENLYEAIKQDRKHILININGLGGVGKTTVARALFHKAKDEFKHIAWVEYQHNIKESLLSSFTNFDDTEEDTEARYRRIKNFLLNATKDTLLFIDNVTDDSDLNFIEGLDVNVVITSRIGRIRNFEKFPICTLSEDQCLDIFYKYYEYGIYDENKEQEGSARNLINLVKCHTLSVELLARAANRPGYPLDKYEADLKAKGFGYPDLDVETAHSSGPENNRTIAKHLVKLFELVEVNHEQQRILKNFSLMPSTEIPAEVKEWLDCNINDIMRLTKLGWLDNSSTGYHMHTIIKEAIRLQYPQAQYEDCKALIGYMSSKEYIKETDVYTQVHERLNIAEAVMERFCGVEKEEVGKLFNNIASIYRIQGKYDDALTWLHKALEICEKILDPDDLRTAATYNNMAVVYDNQGKYDDALTWHHKALEIYGKKLDPDDPRTATYNNMALVYNNQGKYNDALEWHYKALEIYEKKLGIDHPDTATTYNNIAAVYDNQGKLDDALEWHYKALGIREKILGTDHPDTTTTYNNIAVAYNNQGKYDDALTWYHKALEIREKILGTDHPSTATTYNNMAGVYEHQGQYPKALEWHYKAFRIMSKQLGENHPHTRTVLENMYYAYSAHYGKDAGFTEWLKNRMED
ncbi:MAG: tetratricopeptide repeat protein [Defluviitaleaceae bacterium]|nr:tetratricopeptide repeat protein [Defluviitaleaceae bacterium]